MHLTEHHCDLPLITIILVLAGLAAPSGCERPPDEPAPQHASNSAGDAGNAPLPEPRTLDNGLVIEELRLADGPECPPDAQITMNFTAMLADGTVYDSSDLRKRSWTIDLDDPGLIDGLRQGIPGMNVGGTRRLTIPWQLAYGQEGRPPIPPRTDLIFEIELLAIDE